jgi:branched-chain amino acid transport system substrate-binding protein
MVSNKVSKLLAVAGVTVVAAAGCSSSSSKASGGSSGSTTGSASSSGSPTYTIGMITDLTGPAASSSAPFYQGTQARVGIANAGPGPHIKLVAADTATSPTQTLAAAQRLVEQDHVLAILADSPVFFAAEPYLASKGIPVIGASIDGPAWNTDRNMFSILGSQDNTKVTSTIGQFLKLVGVTNVATFGLAISPAASEAAKGAAISAEVAGIKAGYVDPNVALGTTDVDPIVLQMKAAGVDGLVSQIVTNSSYAIMESLRQHGVTMKGALLYSGYGGAMSAAGPGGQAAAQGGYFGITFEPAEMHTAATAQFQAALSKYAGYNGAPWDTQYWGYVSVDALLAGLNAAGKNPTKTSLINAMQSIRSYGADGLLDGHTIGFAMDQRGLPPGAQNCTFFVQWSGSSFHVVSGADPICGMVVPGKTVKPST